MLFWLVRVLFTRWDDARGAVPRGAAPSPS
jgi:hypothetical protein